MHGFNRYDGNNPESSPGCKTVKVLLLKSLPHFKSPSQFAEAAWALAKYAHDGLPRRSWSNCMLDMLLSPHLVFAIFKYPFTFCYSLLPSTGVDKIPESNGLLSSLTDPGHIFHRSTSQKWAMLFGPWLNGDFCLERCGWHYSSVGAGKCWIHCWRYMQDLYRFSLIDVTM